jgi:hypothetical protein
MSNCTLPASLSPAGRLFLVFLGVWQPWRVPGHCCGVLWHPQKPSHPIFLFFAFFIFCFSFCFVVRFDPCSRSVGEFFSYINDFGWNALAKGLFITAINSEQP